MPEKLRYYETHGTKLISLFVKLLFSKERHSLIDLARGLKCSKQTVSRLIQDINRSSSVNVEETFRSKRKYFKLKTMSGSVPALYPTEDEIRVLYMCKAFTKHLLGPELLREASQAIEKNLARLPGNTGVTSKHFTSFGQGTIDYTPHQDTIRTIIKAMEEKKVCKVAYKAVLAEKLKTFYIKPLKLFSHKDTLYLSARMAKYPGKPYKEPDFDPLLAIHRLKRIAMTEKYYEYPEAYNFQKVYDQNFGIVKKASFPAEIEFSGHAGIYVGERRWSPDQKVTRKKDGTIRLKLSVSSDQELIAWILSFGPNAKVIKPKWLVEAVNEKLSTMKRQYER